MLGVAMSGSVRLGRDGFGWVMFGCVLLAPVGYCRVWYGFLLF